VAEASLPHFLASLIFVIHHQFVATNAHLNTSHNNTCLVVAADVSDLQPHVLGVFVVEAHICIIPLKIKCKI